MAVMQSKIQECIRSLLIPETKTKVTLDKLINMEDQDADAAMREMMGFGSFGSNKRQKLNSGDTKRPQRPPTTSSNSTPLGTSRLQSIPSSSLIMTSAITDTDDRAQIHDTVTEHPQPLSADPNTLTSQASNSSLSAAANVFTPSRSQATASHFSASDVRSDPAYWSTASAKESQANEIGYTSPWTGATLTRAELSQYGRGKREVQEDGSTVSVFFKPSFLATQEELWGRWERQREEKAGVT